MSEQARASARGIRDQVHRGRSHWEMLHRSACARLQAKQETLAVIERAKGIIMAQQRCGSDEAFDLLRLASQRSNIKLHVLAAQIVEQVAVSDNYDVTPPLAGRHTVPAAGMASNCPPTGRSETPRLSADASDLVNVPVPELDARQARMSRPGPAASTGTLGPGRR